MRVNTERWKTDGVSPTIVPCNRIFKAVAEGHRTQLSTHGTWIEKRELRVWESQSGESLHRRLWRDSPPTLRWESKDGSAHVCVRWRPEAKTRIPWRDKGRQSSALFQTKELCLFLYSSWQEKLQLGAQNCHSLRKLLAPYKTLWQFH